MVSPVGLVSARQVVELVASGVAVATFCALLATGRHLLAALLALAVLAPALVLAVRALLRQLDAEATPAPLPDWTDADLDVLHDRQPTAVVSGSVWPLPVEQEAAVDAAAEDLDAELGTHWAELRRALVAEPLAELNRISAALRVRGGW